MKAKEMREGLYCIALVIGSGYVLYRIILFVVLMLMFSCGSKKKVVERSKQSTVEIVNKDVQRSKTNDITTNTIIEQSDVITIVRPIDESKASTYNDTGFKNAEIIIEKSEKKEDISVVDKSTIDYKDLSTKKDEINTSSVNKNVDIDRSWGVMDWLWLFLAVAIVLFAIRLYINKINPLDWIKNRLTN